MSNSASSVTAASPSRRKPRISLAIATALGLGYIPKAPGTFGSLAGVALAVLMQRLFTAMGIDVPAFRITFSGTSVELPMVLTVAIVGVWTASRVEAYLGAKDPQIVVVDEVSGQYLALFIGSHWPIRTTVDTLNGFVPLWNFASHLLNWKCLLAGFILFRVFDIWKPFPARQAESLPRGWGIMADDWIAGIYAGLGVMLLRAAGL
jgi:phosphatidylglycerophosphatase A